VASKICFVCGGLSGGGQERALTNFANTFAENGQEITIICLFKTEIFFNIHPSIKIFWPSTNRERNNKLIYAISLIPYIRKTIKQINPDSIISFGDWFNSYTILATRFLNIRTIITNRMGPNLYFGKLIEISNIVLYRFADAMIVQTERAKAIMQERYKIKYIHIVPNPIQPINIIKKNYYKNIVSIGRLSKEKGHSVLIDAFKILEDNSWKLHLIGDGPEMNNLINKISSLNLQENVLLHGHLKKFDYILAESSIFVLPSLYEGFPNALIEAMSIPMACIASNCVAGPSEIITHNVNGLLFRPGDADELAFLLKQIINDENKISELEKEAYKIREKYDMKKISNQFLNILNNSDENITN